MVTLFVDTTPIFSPLLALVATLVASAVGALSWRAVKDARAARGGQGSRRALVQLVQRHASV